MDPSGEGRNFVGHGLMPSTIPTRSWVLRASWNCETQNRYLLLCILVEMSWVKFGMRKEEIEGVSDIMLSVLAFRTLIPCKEEGSNSKQTKKTKIIVFIIVYSLYTQFCNR